MADRQYASYVQPLRLGTESINPSFRGKISDFALIHDQKTTPGSPIRTETYYAYSPGTGAFAPSKWAPILDGRTAEELRGVGCHAHNDFDEVYYFFGSDPIDNTRLGGRVEMWLGHGGDAQKYVMEDPTAVYVPKGIAHNPWIVTRVDDPGHPIMITCISLTDRYSVAPGAVTNYPYPPAFDPDLIGVPQPSTGKYDQYVNRLTLSQDIYITFLLGRVCTPNLMFDDKVCHAPLWTEFFLAYAGGTGVGVPTLADIAKNDGMSWWDWTKGMQHHQSYDEVFLYLPTHPHDILDLGGEAVAYLGEEDYAFTVPTAIYVPGGVLHNPNYFKRVNRPYYMLVIALTDNAKFHEGEFTPSPAPATFRF